MAMNGLTTVDIFWVDKGLNELPYGITSKAYETKAFNLAKTAIMPIYTTKFF